MAKTNTQTVAPVETFSRRYNDDALHGAERMAVYVRLLSRKQGATAQELRDAVGAYTKHNTYSLTLIASKKGYAFVSSDDEASGLTPSKDGLKRYAFRPLSTKAAKAAVKEAPKPAARPRGKPKTAAASTAKAPRKGATGKKMRKTNKG